MKFNEHNTFHYTYHVHGVGGQGACLAVQSVLQEQGLCGHTEWNKPEWRFVFLTHLQTGAILNLLGNLSQRFSIELTDRTITFLRGATLAESNLNNADLQQVKLAGANLRGAQLRQADLRQADLSETDLRQVDLKWANLSECNLSRANLSQADLSRALLTRADLKKSNLSQAKLIKADLHGAILNGADLTKADLSEANLEQAVISETQLAQASSLRNAILPDGKKYAPESASTLSIASPSDQEANSKTRKN